MAELLYRRQLHGVVGVALGEAGGCLVTLAGDGLVQTGSAQKVRISAGLCSLEGLRPFMRPVTSVCKVCSCHHAPEGMLVSTQAAPPPMSKPS